MVISHSNNNNNNNNNNIQLSKNDYNKQFLDFFHASAKSVHCVCKQKYPTLVRARAAKTLQSYEVTTPEEALDLMNALDCHLRSRSTPSARSAILSLILYVVREHLPQLTSKVRGQIFSPLVIFSEWD